MRIRGFAVSIFSLLANALAADVAPQSQWLEPQAADADEQALRDLLGPAGLASPGGTVQALIQLSADNPGTTVSGLAQLAAGLQLLEANRPAEALAPLRHPDISRTALLPYAFQALGDALDAGGDAATAGESYRAAADASPAAPIACASLFRAAECFGRGQRLDRALDALGRTFTACQDDQRARALLAIGAVQERMGDLRAAAESYDRIDSDHPASAEAAEAQRRLRVLARHLTALPAEARAARQLKRALAMADAGRPRDAVATLRAVAAAALKPDDAALLRIRLGRALLALGRRREARAELAAVPPASLHAGEAAFLLARIAASQGPPDAYEQVVARFPGTPWAEEALLSLANFYQKDARDAEALPYYRRLLEGFPDGRHAERAAWRVAWGEYRAGRYGEAAQILERAVRLRPASSATGGLLYWAGRSRLALGESDRARQLLEETRQRFKNTYHGLRAQEALARLPQVAMAAPAVLRPSAPPPPEVPEPQRERIRQLLLIDRLGEAREELALLPPTRTTNATIAWIDSRRGRLRPALVHMKRAYPEWVGEAGDQLPEAVWRIMYPMDFAALLVEKSTAEGLDPALVAALICQESTFNAGALSPAGARGLMQVIPPTGRNLARSLGLRFRPQSLYDPGVSLSFGTRYLREMIERFGGRVERALAAYNAGPHRVEAWTLGRPEIGDEEFIESIPFTETRNYVMTILANREHYRRIYALPPPPAPRGITTAAAGGARP